MEFAHCRCRYDAAIDSGVKDTKLLRIRTRTRTHALTCTRPGLRRIVYQVGYILFGVPGYIPEYTLRVPEYSLRVPEFLLEYALGGVPGYIPEYTLADTRLLTRGYSGWYPGISPSMTKTSSFDARGTPEYLPD